MDSARKQTDSICEGKMEILNTSRIITVDDDFGKEMAKDMYKHHK